MFIPQLFTNSYQGHPPTLVSTCNCNPLRRALLDDNVKTACVDSGTLDNPGGGSSVCHRSRSVRTLISTHLVHHVIIMIDTTFLYWENHGSVPQRISGVALYVLKICARENEVSAR